MPGAVRKDDKAKRIALDILGPPPGGLTDSFGKKKKYKRKKDSSVKDKQYEQEETTNRFKEVGYR